MASSTIAEPAVVVTAGIDTHADVNVAAALDQRGRLLGAAPFPTTASGHRQLEAWLADFGQIDAIGIEGTGAWGAGIARHCTAQGHRVIEVDRPNRQTRYRRGKSDTIDAEAAARAVQAGTATGTPKARTGLVESMRHRARRVTHYQAGAVTESHMYAGWFERMQPSFGLALDAFISSIEGKATAYPTLLDGLRAQMIAEAAVESLHSNRPVKINYWHPE